MKRVLKVSLLLAVFLAGALVPDAEAQRRRGGRRGGGNRAGAGLFKGRGAGRKASAGSPSLGLTRATGPTLTAPAKSSALKSGPLAAEEKRFRELLDEIDAAIAAADSERAAASNRADATGVRLPADVERGSPQWRELQRPIFETADYDASGWLSYREMHTAFEFDQGEYAHYDRDRDGRVGSREFMARYDEVVEQVGAFRLPKPKPEARHAVARTSDELRQAFDANGDGGLDVREVAEVLRAYGRRDADAQVVLADADADGNGRVAGGELVQLGRTMSYAFLAAPLDDDKPGKKATLESLFGRVEARPGDGIRTAGAPWIPGPVRHFQRLDLDANGFVDASEFRALEGGLGSAAPLGAVLAALDLDEDGRLSEREFLTALATARK